VMDISQENIVQKMIHKRILHHETSSAEEAYTAMQMIMNENATQAQIGAFLVALKVLEPTIDEVSAFVRCMKDNARKISPTTGGACIDTCGTGGDALKTTNISTLAALVVAGAGIPVAKHGNRSVTSACGSADILEHFGVNIMADPATVEKSIDTFGIGFMFAPVFHPAMKNVVVPRREIGLQTVFNVLGPLTNPATITGQILGVFDFNIADMMARVLQANGISKFFIVNNECGADELLPCKKNRVLRASGSKIDTLVLYASDFGLSEVSRDAIPDIHGKEEAIQAFIGVLSGNERFHALRDAVLMNAALGIIAGEKTNDIITAVEIARESLSSGKALDKLFQLVEASGGKLDTLITIFTNKRK
nr:anthranilate phosphoribosyltransferase [Candidatus Sigynarchaeota archaeon]